MRWKREIGTILLTGYVHPTGLWKVITNISIMMEMLVDFRYVELGVLDIVIVLEFFFRSCAPFNTYTCGNNVPGIDESVKCTSA